MKDNPGVRVIIHSCPGDGPMCPFCGDALLECDHYVGPEEHGRGLVFERSADEIAIERAAAQSAA